MSERCADLDDSSFRTLVQLATEFATPASPASLVGKYRSGDAELDAFSDAFLRLESLLVPHARENPGLVTAIRAAGRYMMNHDWMPPEDFNELYGFIEPEIPFAELARSS
jgi:hypothetical protein